MYEGSKIHREENPRQRANIFSVLTFFFAYDIFNKSKRKELQEDDIYKVMNDCRSEVLGDALEKRWKIEEGKKRKSLTRTLLGVFGGKYAFYGFLNFIIKTPIAVLRPFATGILVSYFEAGSKTTRNDAILWGCILVGCGFINAVFTHYYLFSLARLGLRMQIALSSLMYRKALKLTTSSLCAVTSGKIVTMMSKDIVVFESALLFSHDLWIGMIQVIIMMGMMYQKIGLAAVIGAGFLIVIIPLQTWIGVKTKQFRLKTSALTDERLRRIQEILTSIKLIKLYTWEKYYTKITHALRIREIQKLRGIFYLKVVILSLSAFSYRVSFFMCLFSYFFLGYRISAEKVFFVITCYKALHYILGIAVPMSITQLAEAKSSVKRIKSFLLVDENDASSLDIIKAKRVILKGVRANILDKVVLRDITLELVPPALIGVTGGVGSGKTTFLKVIMKDVRACEGSVYTTGEISYASQEPWLFPGTIRQNILFGNVFDYERYDRVLKVCALIKDLDGFSERDMTVVNDKGLNLSKGQQARINLARAVYKKADLYLLDDVLSSVDLNVGKYVFKNCIQDFLKDSLRLLICHNKEFLAKTDEVIVLEAGAIKSKGQYDEQVLRNINVDSLIKLESSMQGKGDVKGFDDYGNENIDDEKAALLGEEVPHIKIYQETKVAGKVNLSVYIKYFKHAGGWKTIPIVIFIMLTTQFMGMYFDLFIKNWLKVEEKKEVPIENVFEEVNEGVESYESIDGERLKVIMQYALILGVYVMFVVLELFTYFTMTTYAAKNVHKVVFERIMGATMTFFDSHLSGTILNRLSRDMGFIDEFVGYSYFEAIRSTFALIVILILVLLHNPLLGIPALAFFAIVLYVMFRFLRLSRSLRRLESISRAPVIGYLNSTLDGLTTIRAIGNQEILMTQFDNHQNLFSSVAFMNAMSKRAFALWLDILGNLFSACVIFSFFLLNDKLENIAGNVGIAVTQVIGLSAILQYGVRQWAEIENTMTSVERVLEFGEAQQEDTSGVDPDNWPTDGKIEYNDVSLTYPNSDEKILQGITFTIQPKQKIGIIGRTGAGKSSIISALFRLYKAEGPIFIDGTDVSKIELPIVRSKISIIPQDPVMFKGTVRTNLDPNNEYTDLELWNALGQVGLKGAVEKMGLSSEVEEGGSNWSIGQKQLFSLARVVLRDNKIIVLDEATSNMDPKTDVLIQETMKRVFEDCTILTIAHRINTVIHSDRIMVVDDGKVIEYDEPGQLLGRKAGAFYSVAKQAGFVKDE